MKMNSYLETLLDSSVPKPRTIVCAAMRRIGQGELLLGVRHADEHMGDQYELHGFDEDVEFEQGFIDSKRNFLTREEAWKVALEAGQIKYRCGGDTINGGTLFSENLY